MRRRDLVIPIALLVALLPATLAADPIIVGGWPQPGGPGSPVFITYSYSNLLDNTIHGAGVSELRQATVEALTVWAMAGPIHFVERPDSGPPASDAPYDGADHPQIRIGHHAMTELGHSFFPSVRDGRAGDVHIASDIPWTLGTNQFNLLEVLAHELGHALGLGHETGEPAIMNPFFPQARFAGLGTGFLLPADIRAIQSLYGVGVGSVAALDPVPEPATLLLVGAGLAMAARARRWRRVR